jgi:hypothetical protein
MNAEQLEKWLEDHLLVADNIGEYVVSEYDLRALFAGKVLVAEVPMISEKMKAECMGEFSVKSHERCQDCEGRGCHGCAGKGEIILRVNVPWAVMKDIYKRMYQAMLAASQEQVSATAREVGE